MPTPSGGVSGRVSIRWNCPDHSHSADDPQFGWSMTFDPPLGSAVLIALLTQIIANEREGSE